MLLQALCIISNPSMNSNWGYSPEKLNSGRNWRYFVPCDHESWWMNLKNNRAPLLYYIKLCASFQTIGEFKLELQPGNAWFESKSAIFWAAWPQNMTDDTEKQQGISCILHQALRTIWKPSMNSNWSYSPETTNLGQIGRFLEPRDLEIWRMTLKYNRAPLLCYFKLCALFRIHWWIQTGVTVRKRPVWVKFDDLLSRVTLKFDVWPWKTVGLLFYATSSFVHHFVAIGQFKLELQSGNASFGSNSTIFLAIWPWNLTYDLEKQQGTFSMLFQALCIIS